MATLYTDVYNCAQDRLDQDAMIFYNGHISFGKLMSAIDSFARYLTQRGISQGDVVTLCIPNTPSSAVALYAINKIGAVCQLVHPYIPLPQLKQDMAKTNSKLLIVYDVYTIKNGNLSELDCDILLSKSSHYMGLAGKVFFHLTRRGIQYNKFDILEKHFVGNSDNIPCVEFGDDDIAIYLPSGGSTGNPKIIGHRCHSFNLMCSQGYYFLSRPVPEYKVMYSVLPIFHGYGLCMNMHMCLTNGLTNVMTMKFSANRMAHDIVKYRAEILTGVPTMYQKLADNKYFNRADLSSLRECFVGGDSISPQLAKQFDDCLVRGGSCGALLSGYGMTEIVAVATVNMLRNNRIGSIGTTLPINEICIAVDGKSVPAGTEGEIMLRSELMMVSYVDDDVEFVTIDNKQWLPTGDYGYMDSDGYLYYIQRVKNILKVNGVPVFPSVIESAIAKVAGVDMCCAIGIPCAKRGQAVKLYIKPTKGADHNKLRSDIMNTAAKELIIYARPHAIEIVDSLPISIIGKVDRKKLEQLDKISRGE